MLPTEILEAFTLKHGNRYDYSQFEYENARTKGKIVCSEHGDFYQRASNHRRGSNCPKCAIKEKFKGALKNSFPDTQAYYRALKRRQSGMPASKVFADGYVRSTREINPNKVYGITYPNLEEAVRVIKPSACATTIARWIKSGMSPDEAFGKVANPGYAKGVIYLVTHVASHKCYVGLTVQALEQRWRDHQEQSTQGTIKHAESLHKAIRQFGKHSFTIKVIDTGMAKVDLEAKERRYIKELNTKIPNGFNLTNGGESGGSDKKATWLEGKCFPSVKEATQYLSETQGISMHAAKKRISVNRVNVKTPPKKGEGVCKTKLYKAWSTIKHGYLSPNSKSFVPGLKMHAPWYEYESFAKDVGEPENKSMVYTRICPKKGIFPDNCMWMTRSEARNLSASRQASKRKKGRQTKTI
jgi:group I intron endonuclease